MSAIIIAAYQTMPLTDAAAIDQLGFLNNPHYGRTLAQQAGIQIAGTFASMGLGIGFGFIAGVLMRLVSIFEPS